MSCTKCNNKNRCGCGDTSIDMPNSFSNCPDPCLSKETCTEVFDMACICYQGEDIIEYNIQKGDRLDEIMQKILLGLTNNGCATFGDTTACQSPINLTIANLTSTTFDISWDTVPSATSYVVEFKDASSSTWLLNPTVTAPVISDTVIGLVANTVYDIRVNAICATGSCYSLNLRIKTTA